MKILKYIAVVLMIATTVSCSDYLDKEPEDQLTLNKVFNDKTRTEDWLAGIYSSVPDPYWGFMRSIGYDALGDDAAPSTGWEQFGWNVIAKQTGNWSPSSSWDSNYWDLLPKRIRSAYIFIENVQPLPAQQVTEEDVENMKNEARFLIAYYYSLLLESYGPVPFTDRILTADEDLLLERRPYDELVAWIDNELQQVAAALPAKYSDGSKFGRATSIMALAVRARMLLFAASPLVNGNPDYNGYTNRLGEPLFNSTYDASKWDRAAGACKEMIDKAHAAGHELYKEYNDDGSIDPFLSYQNMMFRKTNDGNNEILFARPESNHWEYDRHSQPRGTGGNGGLGVTQSLVDAFFMENGLPINDPNSGYVEKGFSDAPEVRNTKWIEVQGDQAGKEGQVTLAGTYNMYTHREPRFYISVLYNRAWHRRENRTTRFMLGEWDGGPTHDAPQNGYLMRKKVHPDHDPRNGTNPYRPGILYRLGEAYLNYAEALNESEPGNPDIAKYVNLVRQRAGIPDLATGLDQDAMREAIHRERRVELNCEDGIRYHDIRRWKIGEEALDRDFWGMNFFGKDLCDDPDNPDCFFVRKVYQSREFSKKNYWVPIHQTEIDINPELVQNPYW